MGSCITRGHHLVKHDPLALGRQYEHEATRFKGKAVNDLARQDGHAAVAVHIDQI